MEVTQAIVHNRVTDRMQSKVMGGTRKKNNAALSTEETYERIWSAIMDHSLPPETREEPSARRYSFGITCSDNRGGLTHTTVRRVHSWDRLLAMVMSDHTLTQSAPRMNTSPQKVAW